MNITIENIGKIKEVDIVIRDLTIFVGKNSTNKSYVAQTIYMLNKILNNASSNTNEFKISFLNNYLKRDKTKHFISEIKKLKKIEDTKKEIFPISEDDYETFFTRKVTIFLDDFEIEQLVSDIKNFFLNYLVDRINRSFNSEKKVLDKLKLNIDINIFNSEKITFVSDKKEYDEIVFLESILDEIIKQLTTKTIKNQYYFPASRTGFVLAFDEIVSGVLRDRFGGQPTATKLTEPTIDYISNFADIKSDKFEDSKRGIFDFLHKTKKIKKNQIEQIFNFIETRIIKGKILEEKKNQGYTQFYLKTNNSEKLALHLSSSSTVELLPLIVFFKHFTTLKDKIFIIEEPEAHLHPQAQIEIARLLVMIVNAGAKLIITTHSDYILNEISNLIKLSNIKKEYQKKYLEETQLSKEVIISQDRVSAYLFKEIDVNSVNIKTLEVDKYGISNDDFDEILDELLEKTEIINRYLEN